DKFRTDFVQAGVTQFGSGWGWLEVGDGRLVMIKTANGENPLGHGATPILGCDVWEHSYYIDYRNGRQKYLEAFVDNLINWDYVQELYAAAGGRELFDAVGLKAERGAVHAVPQAGRCRAVVEDVAEVRIAGCAADL